MSNDGIAARTDLVVSPVRSGIADDQMRFQRLADAIVNEEHAEQSGVRSRHSTPTP